jgi:parallel beta-helix repeat protein
MPDVEPLESDDTGLSGWVLAAVAIAAVALFSVPLWFLIQVVLDADPAPAPNESGGEASEVAPADDIDAPGELLTESSGVDLPDGVVGVVVGTVALDIDLEGTVLMTPGATLNCGDHTIRGSSTRVGVAMANDATVRNCLISGFNTGVGLSATDGAVVENVEVTNSRIGFYLVNGTTNATITGSTSIGNEIGFLFEPSVSSVHIEANHAVRNWRSGFMMGHTDDSVLIGNTATAGGSGFWITNSNRNQFLDNTVHGATEWFSIGVFEGSSDNLFQGNEVNGGGVAIAVNSRAAGNTFQENLLVSNAKGAHVEANAGTGNTFIGNQVTDNSHVGLWDDTPAPGTRYDSNICSRNKDANSVPDGLC